MNKKAELVKNTIIIFLGKISTQFISFFLLPLYTAYLNTGDYGTIDLIITYVSLLVPVITLQQEMATFRFLIDCREDNNRKSKVIYNSVKSVLISALFFAVVFGIISLFINIPYKIYILLNVIVTMFSGLLLQSTRGLGKNVIYSIASTITGVTTLLLNVLFIVILGIGAKGILISTIISNTICVIFVSYALKIYKYIKFENDDKSISREMLKYSLPLIPNGISWWVINVSDRTIISLMINVASNGIYAVSTKFSSILSAMFSIFSMSWTESASVHINDKDRDEFFSDIADTVVRLFSCLCIGIVAFMPYVFGLFIKEAYNEAYNYIPINLLAAFFNCVVGIYSSIYIAKKLTKKVASTSIFAAIINISINLLFIKLIGVYAACISTVAAYLAMAIYRHFDLKKYVKLKYRPLTIIVTAIAFAVIYTSYYINNKYLNIISLLFAIVYSIIMNRNIIITTFIKLKSKLFKRSLNENN